MSGKPALNETCDPWENPLQVQHKTFPQYTQGDYLHLADLNAFIKTNGSQNPLIILDYGAGASPYRKYFPKADYRRADITGTSSLDYHIASDSIIPEEAATFDLILSTQVAEHLPNPGVYFREASRLLKKGGIFILTTHGIWEEHGSPFDFQRWTATGLRRDLSEAGFEQMDIYKLTCGLRATATILTRSLFDASPPLHPINRLFFKIFRWSYSRLFPLIYRICDWWWPHDAQFKEEAGNPGPNWYISIAAIAKK